MAEQPLGKRSTHTRGLGGRITLGASGVKFGFGGGLNNVGGDSGVSSPKAAIGLGVGPLAVDGCASEGVGLGGVAAALETPRRLAPLALLDEKARPEARPARCAANKLRESFMAQFLSQMESLGRYFQIQSRDFIEKHGGSDGAGSSLAGRRSGAPARAVLRDAALRKQRRRYHAPIQAHAAALGTPS